MCSDVQEVRSPAWMDDAFIKAPFFCKDYISMLDNFSYFSIELLFNYFTNIDKRYILFGALLYLKPYRPTSKGLS